MTLTGGCQCGAVRFAVETADVVDTGLCHCRMCQKHFSSPYAALTVCKMVTWLAATPSYFQSSEVARRGFCNQCGSPLSWEAEDEPIELASIAFDDPSALVPSHQSSHSTRVKWTDNMAAILWRKGAFESAGIASFQHPDQDTTHD